MKSNHVCLCQFREKQYIMFFSKVSFWSCDGNKKLPRWFHTAWFATICSLCNTFIFSKFVNMLLILDLSFLAVKEKHVVFVTLCSDVKILDPCLCWKLESPHTVNIFFHILTLSFKTNFQVFCSFLPRLVSCSQRGLQSPVYCGTRERGCVFLSPWASPGLQQQDLWGGGLLQSPPEVQPGVRAVQDHGEVFLLSRVDAGPRRRQLSQHR